VVAALAALFGVATVVAGGRALFGPAAARAAARAASGSYPPAIVWFNFLAGFAYLAAAAGITMGRPWGARLALGIAVATGIALVAFALWAASGGPHEARTAAALPFRAVFWAILGLWALRRLRPRAGGGGHP